MASACRSKFLIFIPGNQDYHWNMGYSLSKALNRLGVDNKILSSSLPPNELQSAIERYSPDVIFEINRTRNQLPFPVPNSIKHVAWLQDSRVNGKLHYFDPTFGGSDITYTLLPPQNFGLIPAQCPPTQWRILHTGVDTDFFFVDPTRAVEREIAFCGYLPTLADNESASQHVVLQLNGRSLTYADLQNHLLDKCSVAIGTHDLPDVHRAMLDKINHTFDIPLELSHFKHIFQDDPRLIYFDTELPRIPERTMLIDIAVSAGKLDIFGPNTWLNWAAYRPYYRKMLLWQSDLADIYRSSLINLHNGAFGMHSRVLECMASGGAVFVNEVAPEVAGVDIAAHFEPGKHYIPYTFENLGSQIEYYLKNPDTLKAIGSAAAEAVGARHQWAHRAEQILGDLDSL